MRYLAPKNKKKTKFGRPILISYVFQQLGYSPVSCCHAVYGHLVGKLPFLLS